MKQIKYIKFGIPTLDNLFLGNERRDIAPGGIVLPILEGHPERTTICIVGPDGSGKSLFALHLASRYAADLVLNEAPGSTSRPHVIFVSTDFSFARANSAWENFDLNHPFGRKIPFESLLEPNQRRSKEELERAHLSVKLEQYFPYGEIKTIAHALEEGSVASLPSDAAVVKFVDVAKTSSGDDWALVSRLLSLLPKAEKDEDPSHLLIIDAVEGFETLVGEIDQFGERQSRRARIAQIIRLASEKCHVVFVAEEPENHPSIPEQFVADVVLRLRSQETQGTTRNTLEIEKARGQRHALGRQPYFIRDGSGSSTGSERNLDDPRIFDGKPRGEHSGKEYELGVDRILNSLGFDTHLIDGNFQGYIHVTHSIPQRSREILELDRETGFSPEETAARFGITELDSLLTGRKPESRGLPSNRLSALIGEAGTHKSDLAQAWMGRAFYDLADGLFQTAEWLMGKSDEVPALLSEGVREHALECRKWLTSPPPGLESLPPAWRERFVPKGEVLRNEVPFSVGQGEEKVTFTTEVSSRLIDPAFAYLYRFRHFTTALETIREEKEGSPSRALRIANLLMRHRYGLTCENVGANLVDEGVAVLLSTRDDTSDVVAERICERLLRHFRKEEYPFLRRIQEDQDAQDLVKKCLEKNVRRRLIVRRLEIHNATPEGVFHIIEALVHAGRRVLLGEEPYQIRFNPQDKEDKKDRERYDKARREYDHRCFQASGRIRFVLDDFSSFRDSYPDLRNDSVFLPFLVFWLGRMGVTGLIVCTGDGQPTREVADPVEVQIRALVAQRLQTWRVGFHGTQRVAIAAIPSAHWDKPSPVRELILGSSGELDIEVSREFELYSNLGQAKPERVPLEMRLFSHTPAAQAFVAEENKVFRSVFGSQSAGDQAVTDPGAIVWGAKTEEYDVLRDFCHLQGGSRLERTIVLQVDEFWLSNSRRSDSIGRTGLRDLFQYREEKALNPTEDFYDVFRGDPRGNRMNHFSSIDADGKAVAFPRIKRDRIPFTWDFGLLLCDRNAWLEARNEELPTFPEYFPKTSGSGRTKSTKKKKPGRVEDVWKLLPGGLRADSRQTLFGAQCDPEKDRQVGWHDFLMAATEVARVAALRRSTPISAFDFSRMSKGSLSCIVFEIWASEIYRWKLLKGNVAEAETFRNHLKCPAYDGGDPLVEGLETWVNEYRTELFLTILLLSEVLSVDDILDPIDPFEIRVGKPTKTSVAVRHWYQTACNHADHLELTPVGLPGHFSVRGDWFLAVAEGSRSDLLAERALDLLSSRRSNLMRMQLGMGLATRNLGPPDQNRTRLSWFKPTGNRDDAGGDAKPSEFVRRWVTHSELAGLGANSRTGHCGFSWMFRSSLKDYDGQSRVFRKWLAGMFQRWYEHERSLGRNWVRGFELYDYLCQLRVHNGNLKDSEFWTSLSGRIWPKRLSPDGTLKTWFDVDRGCADLLEQLKTATKGLSE